MTANLRDCDGLRADGMVPASDPAERPPSHHRADVEGLRAVAVILVVLYHAGVPHLAGGYVGVDVFFVISGFLITRLLVDEIQRDGRLSVSGFYARRARRLLPMATLVLIATAIAFSLILLPLDRAPLRGDIDASALYYANWHFAAAAVAYGTNAGVNPALHYWSLSVEEQFYIVWPLILVAVVWSSAKTGRPAHLVRRVAAVLLAIAAVSLTLSIVLTSRSAPYAYYGLQTRAWELAAGGLLALGSARLAGRVPPVASTTMGWVGISAIAVSAIEYGAGTTFPGIAAALPVAGALLILAAGLAKEGPGPGVGRVLATPPMRYGGRISYSLYLWHWPCLVLLGTLGLPQRSMFAVAHGAQAALAVLIAVGLSVASYHLIESPSRRSAWMQDRWRALATGAALMALTVVAAVAFLPNSQGAIRVPVEAYVAPLPAGTSSGVPSERPVLVRLAMTPGQARTDHPKGTGDCYGGYGQTVAPAGCAFGDRTGAASVALVGDSHAEAMFPAVEKLAIARHWKLWLWAKPACPMIDLTVQLPQFDNHYVSCTSWQHSVLQRLGSIPRLRSVFVTSYAGALQIPDRYAVGRGASLTARQVPAAWRDAWSTTDRGLSAVAGQVVVIRDVPQPIGDVPDCLDAHAPDEVPCSPLRSSALRNSDVLYDAERPVSTSTTIFIDPTSVLCPGQVCPVITSGGDIIYRDDEHLTATVSALLAPALEAELAPRPPARPAS